MPEPAAVESVPLGSSETAKVLPFPIPGSRAASATVLLVGNPNVGKSLLFKNLTHRYVNVSNFPGITVEITKARATFQNREIEVVDSPGVNDLSPRSDDARVTLKLLEQNPGATVVQVADAKNLRRAFGLVPGSELRLLQRHPSFVVEIGETVLALDADVAGDIVLKRPAA